MKAAQWLPRADLGVTAGGYQHPLGEEDVLELGGGGGVPIMNVLKGTELVHSMFYEFDLNKNSRRVMMMG